MTHEDLRELLGAYALDAVDAGEAVLLEQHVRICSECRTELAELREAAALLSYPIEASAATLWERVVDGLDGGVAPPQFVMPPRGPPADTHESRRPSLVTAVVVLFALVCLLAAGWGWDHRRATTRLAQADRRRRWSKRSPRRWVNLTCGSPICSTAAAEMSPPPSR